ncbi:MAG TPA: ribbon-helix-helix protein, CopG family [Rhizomicrobium sp.]
MTKDVTLSLRVDRKLSDRVGKLAKALRRSKSSLIVVALENYLGTPAEKAAWLKVFSNREPKRKVRKATRRDAKVMV